MIPQNSSPGTSRLAVSLRVHTLARKALMATISLGVVLVLWHLSVGTIFNPHLVASPAATFAKVSTMVATGELFLHVGASLRRVLIGYVTGCALGIVAGAAIGRFVWSRELTDPVLELIRPISPVAMVPLAMLWFGIGETSKYFIIIYATLIIVLLNTAAGVARTPITRIRAAQCSAPETISSFIKSCCRRPSPTSSPACAVALGFSFMGIVAAELIGAREGLGFLIMNSQLLLQTDQLFVGLLTLGVVGLIVDRVFRICALCS